MILCKKQNKKKKTKKEIHKKFTSLKNVIPQTKNNEYVKPKVLDNVEDLFNDLYYIYKERYEEEKDALNENDTKNWLHKIRLADSEEEDKQTDKKFNKKEPPKRPAKVDAKKFIQLIARKETGMKRELFKKIF